MPFYTQKQAARIALRKRVKYLHNSPDALAELVYRYRVYRDFQAAAEKRGRRVRFNEARREAITYRRLHPKPLAA